MGLRFKMKDGSMKMPAMSRTTAPKAAPKAKVETAVAGSAEPTKAAEPTAEKKVTTDDDLDSFLDELNI